MSITASQLIGMVQIQGAKESVGQLMEMGVATDAADVKLKNLAAGGVLVAGAALVGIGAKSVEMAGAFEQSTNLLITSANEVPKNIDLIRSGLLKMSVDTATPIAELVKGMFNIESANYHGADAIKIEAAAARGARVENADLAATTDTLTTAMHNYHEPASQAVDVMNSFRMAASIGKMRMDDLTGALRNVLPIASAAGVSLTDVEAALSTMSLAGDKGAMAGTHLQMMLTKLLAPTGQATSTLKEMGLTTQEIADEMKVSLPGAVQMITDAVGKKFPVGSAAYIAALSSIVGGSKEMKAILELSGMSLKTFTDDAKQLGPTMKANSTAVDGWTTVQSNLNFKLDAAKNAVSALMISVGEKLLPVVGQLADAVTPLIQGFAAWVTAGGNVGGAIGQNLLPPLESLATNVGESVGLISTWVDKSGTAKAVINDLGLAVNVTSQALGTLVGWTSELVRGFNEDTPAAETLKIVLIGLAGAFVALKVVDTATQFGQFFSKLSEGEGIVSNLASSFKNKLAKAADDFLTNQAPNFKKAMDGVKGSAEAAAEAEVKVGTAASTRGSTAWFADLEASLTGVEGQANAASAAEEAVGTTAETKMAGGVAVGSAESEASLAGVGAAATRTKGEIASVGPAMEASAATGIGAFGALAAGIVTAGIGAIIALEAYMLKDAIPALIKSWNDADFKPPPRYGDANTQMRNISRLTGSQISNDANIMENNVTGSVKKTYQEVVADLTNMKNQGLEQTSALTWQASDMFAAMGNRVGIDMANMDAAAKGYWNDVASYIDNHPLNVPLLNQGASQHYASGTDSAPGGRALVGERGAELVLGPTVGNLLAGSKVINHEQTMAILGGGGNQPQDSRVIPNSMLGGMGGGGSQRIVVEIPLIINGQEFARATIDDIMNLAMRQSILVHGGRLF